MNPPGKDARIVRTTITRSSNVDPYSLGDVIHGLFTFDGVGRKDKGATGWIVNASLVSSVLDGGTPLDADLYLFNASPTVAADNAAFAPTDDQVKNNLLGVIKFTSELELSANTIWMADPDQLPLAFKCTDTTNDIYGVLVARSAYTPASGEVITVALHVDNN
jgi:hypothetical protein